ncbi:MAG: site-specific integrase [Candidatus Paceibacterota bacterium]|jgi:site-specific recombinase XerD
MNKFEELYSFIDRAIKNRNYAENTGISLKTALRLFEKELNEEEINSIDKFNKNIEQIYHSVCSKNKNFSASSLATYKSRILKVLTDYKKYGIDPTKMSNWPRKTISPHLKKVLTDNNLKEKTNIFTETNNSFHSFEFGGIKLLIPKTSKTTDAIMDGELKGIKVELKDFAEKFCKQDDLPEETNKDKE